jgi:hypothetical protein
MPKEKLEAETVDESNLSALRLSQSFLESGGAKKILSTVPVRKPRPQHFVRAGQDFRQPFAVIELKEDHERYLVTPSIAAALPAEIVTEMLFTAITRQKVVFLWPVRMPAADGRSNEWHRSGMEHAERAMQAWIRVITNMELGAYEAIEAHHLKFRSCGAEEIARRMARTLSPPHRRRLRI